MNFLYISPVKNSRRYWFETKIVITFLI